MKSNKICRIISADFLVKGSLLKDESSKYISLPDIKAFLVTKLD
ncbi:hypothetical protein [Pediococcus ethanolidurans]|nr:hypothetical protein [Pediococcus ethanolidurans]